MLSSTSTTPLALAPVTFGFESSSSKPLSFPPFRSAFTQTHARCNQMTVADIMIAYLLKVLKDGVLDGVPATIADPYPKLVALYDSVVGEPKIAAFIAKHAK